MDQEYRFFVGIDWAKEEHTVCVLDAQRRVLDETAVPHSGAGLKSLVERLAKLSGDQPRSVAVAIEVPRGAVVEYLIEHAYAVYSLNPKQMDRFRDRHTVAGAKDDRRDAFVLADALRTDLVLYHRVVLDAPLIIRLRELSRTHEDIQQETVRCEHQLRELLNRYYPQMLALCPSADKPWFWELIELIPLPGAKFPRSKVRSVLSRHRIRKWDTDGIAKELAVPALRMAPGAAEAASEHVVLVLPLLAALDRQKDEVCRRIDTLMETLSDDKGQYPEHRDVTILRSLPGVGRVVSATMLAEASQPLSERNYHGLRAYCGIAPVTRQSGKKRSVSMRNSCNLRLRNAVYHWSRVSTQVDKRSHDHYAELRARGHSHGRALRGVADRLLAMLIAMLRSGKVFDPTIRPLLRDAKVPDAGQPEINVPE